MCDSSLLAKLVLLRFESLLQPDPLWQLCSTNQAFRGLACHSTLISSCCFSSLQTLFIYFFLKDSIYQFPRTNNFTDFFLVTGHLIHLPSLLIFSVLSFSAISQIPIVTWSLTGLVVLKFLRNHIPSLCMASPGASSMATCFIGLWSLCAWLLFQPMLLVRGLYVIRTEGDPQNVLINKTRLKNMPSLSL